MANVDVELEHIGSYPISTLLHRGSTSSLYLGTNPKRKKDNQVVIRVLHTPFETVQAREAFRSRTKLLEKIKGRQLIEVADSGFTSYSSDQDNHGFIVMGYAPYQTYRHQFTPGQQLAPKELRTLVTTLAPVLAYAHSFKCIHGNLHPGNIFIHPTQVPHFLLSDFSLTLPAASFSDILSSALAYMAPEQLRGNPCLASDQYALATIIYEQICGRLPFEHATLSIEELIQQKEQGSIPAPSSLNAEVSPAIEQILLQALSPDPTNRYQHIQDFSNDYLNTLLGLKVSAKTRQTTPKVSIVTPAEKIKQSKQTSETSIESNSQHHTLEIIRETDAPPSITATTVQNNGKNSTETVAEANNRHSTPTEKPVKSKTKRTVKEIPGTDDDTKALPESVRENEGKAASTSTLPAEEVTTEPATSTEKADRSLLKQRYVLGETIHQGESSRIHLATDTLNKERQVVIKVTQPAHDMLSTIKEEVPHLKELRHQNLPRIYDAFEHDSHWYLVMEYIEGKVLDKATEPLPVEKVITIGEQIANGLLYLLDQKAPIYFVGITPSRLMLAPTGRVYLLILGSTAPVDAVSDIYNLGSTLYQLLTGKAPADNLEALSELIAGKNTASARLGTLLQRMLVKEKDQATIKMEAALEELRDIASELRTAQLSPQPAQQQSVPREKKVASPAKNKDLQATVTADLCQGGVLSQSLPGYEERPAQVEMATLVAQAIMQDTPAIIEASTGTGKSLAYLVPIVRSGRIAIISTANKALQEQLFYKDIPFVQKYIKHFDAALIKGVGNYICLDRVESERVGMQFYAKNKDFSRMLDVINDPPADFNGDFETLGFQLPGELRSKVCADSDQCAWAKCSYFGDCYVREMRTRAERAQVIVVNHTLLLLDAAMGGFLLPPRDVIVLDEAHHLEEEATRSFTISISQNSIITLLAQRMLKDHSQLSLQDDANKALYNLWRRLEIVADPGFKGRANLTAPVEEGLKLASIIGDLADSLRKQRPKDLPEKESQLYDKLLKRTQNLSQNIRIVFSVDRPTKFVYYVERIGAGRGGSQLQVSAAPLDITSWLKERLFDQCNVICTSATLATIGPNPANPQDKGPNFAYFRKRVGLDPVENPDVIERILPLTFDYEEKALLYLPRHLPLPAYGEGSEEYTKAIAREMYSLVKQSKGRAFLLFSSKRMLDQAFELMAPHLDFPLLRQGDMTRLELTRKFREEKGAVLFGLKSFWEGVDIAGDALSLVVIDKLPFDPPDDPVHEARVAQMKAAGENWFGTYVLPQAVLRLKQGIGRLLRTREDSGVMAILDTRLHTKGYGRMVLDALPPARRTSSMRDVALFFARQNRETPYG